MIDLANQPRKKKQVFKKSELPDRREIFKLQREVKKMEEENSKLKVEVDTRKDVLHKDQEKTCRCQELYTVSEKRKAQIFAIKDLWIKKASEQQDHWQREISDMAQANRRMEAEALKRIRQQDEFETATLQMILAKQEQMKREYV